MDFFENKYKTLLEHSPDIIIEIDSNYKIIFINRIFEYYHGENADEVLGANALDFLAGVERDRARQAIETVLSTGTPQYIEIKYVDPDGNEYFYESRHIRFDKNVMVIVSDITERKKEEKQMLILKLAVDTSLSGYAIADLSGQLIYTNRQMLDAWGYEEAEAVGQHVSIFFKDMDLVSGIVRTIMSAGRYVGELVARRKDNTLFIILLSAHLVKDEKGKDIYMMGSFLDVTSQKFLKDAISESNEKIEQLTERLLGEYITKLSEREIEVIECILQGARGAGDLEKMMEVSSSNVSTYISRIKQKLEIKDQSLFDFVKNYSLYLSQGL